MTRHVMVLGLLAVIGSACATNPIDEMRAEYEIERAAWQAMGATAYTYQLRISCFCPVGPYPVRVTVEDGVVTSVAWVDPEPGFSGDDPDQDFYGRTIDDLYDVLGRAFDTEADAIGVTYDAGAHYPAQIDLDYYRNAVDDEVTYRASGFEVPQGTLPTN